MAEYDFVELGDDLYSVAYHWPRGWLTVIHTHAREISSESACTRRVPSPDRRELRWVAALRHRAHFHDCRPTLNRDGTWGHGGTGTISNRVTKWLQGWVGMSLEASIKRLLGELVAGGHGAHAHLDDALGQTFDPEDGQRWVALARQVAESALQHPGRFMVVVPLGRSPAMPTQIRNSTDIQRVDERQPPAVYFLADLDPPRTWVGEYYRRDLHASSAGLLEYVSAHRELDAARDEGQFETGLYFEPRR